MNHESYQPHYDTPLDGGRPIVSASGERLLFLTPEEQLRITTIRNRHFAMTTLIEPSLQEHVFIDANQSRRGLPTKEYQEARQDLTDQYDTVIARGIPSQLDNPADQLRYVELQARYLRYAAHYFLEGILPAAMTSGLAAAEQVPAALHESAFDTIAGGYFSAQDVVRQAYDGKLVFSYPFTTTQVVTMADYLVRRGKQTEAEMFLAKSLASFARPVARTFVHYLQKAQHLPDERIVNQHADTRCKYPEPEYPTYVAIVYGTQAITHALFDELPLAKNMILKGYTDIKALCDAGDVLPATYLADFVMTAEAVFGRDAEEIQSMKELLRHLAQKEYDALPQPVKTRVDTPLSYPIDVSNIHNLIYRSPFSAELYEQAKIVHALANRAT